MPQEKYAPQKKCLKNTRKQLRVWVENEKYDRFKEAVERNGDSIYSLIHRLIDEYLEQNS